MELKYLLVIFVHFHLICIPSFAFAQEEQGSIYDIVQHVKGFLEHVRPLQDLEHVKVDLENSHALDNIQSADFKTFHSSLIDVFNNASNSCVDDLRYTAQNINLKDIGNSWALQMVDAFGKPESGLLQGNVKWIGEFDECRKVYAPKHQNISSVGGFHGKYCSMQALLVFVNITIGICVPETCDSSDFMNSNLTLLDLAQYIPALKNVPSIVVQSIACKPNTRTLTGAAIATIFLMSIFFILVLIGSSITVIKFIFNPNSTKNLHSDRDSISKDTVVNNEWNSNEEMVLNEGSPTKISVFIEKCEPFFNCFCLFTNGSKLLNTDATEGQLLCLHGIRFFSMTWVILCHMYTSPANIVRNMKGTISELDNLPFQVLLNGFYSVDSFFVLSGFLMAYLYFQEAAKKDGKIPWLYFYVHRYLRLTPVYMMAMAFYTTILVYTGSGPFWTDTYVEPNCQQNWWINALYINNIVDSTHQCMGWSWYLANDMQFFVISPLFLITLWRWPKIGYSILGVFFCGTWITAFVITYHYNLNAGGFGDVKEIMKDPTLLARWTIFFDKIYIKPYTRIGPYLVGIAVAYLLFKRKSTEQKINKVVLCVGWVVATVVGLTCVYGLYHTMPGRVASSFYNSLTRTSYAACLSWVIFVCLSGQGGVVDKILSYKLFIPLSRLTYCAYLIHPMICMGYITALKTTIYFTHPTMIILFLGLLLVTYAASLLVSLIFESPLIRVEKLVRSKFQS